VKTVQGGLFVVIGLGLLWLAVTGRLDKIGEAWDYVVHAKPFAGLPGSKDEKGSGGTVPSSGSRGTGPVLSTFRSSLPPSLARALV
jgi:hypothetical protein